MSGDFKAALLEADAGLGGLTPAGEARLRTRLGASLYRQRLWWRYPVTALASCAAGVLLAFAVLRPPAPRVLAGLKVEEPSAGFQAAAEGGDLVVRAGEATLQLDGATARVTRPGRLRREPDGVRVLSGRVELDVDKRGPAAAPLKVRVSDGEIEVRGTRFAVDQIEGGGGAALLWEGVIVFRAPDGRQIELKPGQSVAWPLPPPAPVDAAAKDESFAAPEDDALGPLPVPQPPGTDWSAHDRLLRAHTLLERIPRLREAGHDAQAAAELELAMKLDLPAAARERLSWELVDVYSTELWDTAKGCRQAKDHLWRYPAGRFDGEVRAARASMGCAPR